MSDKWTCPECNGALGQIIESGVVSCTQCKYWRAAPRGYWIKRELIGLGGITYGLIALPIAGVLVGAVIAWLANASAGGP